MFIASLVALLLLLIPPPAVAPLPQPSEVLFVGEIPRLHIEVTPEDVDRLRNDPRGMVKATLNDGERTIDIGIRLKGSAGSFREVDDRPALTVDVDRFDADSRFRGLKKFHLNNSVQDDSYLNEALATEIFRAAGIPATRVTHARVWLNGRDLGLYVLKESFDVQFLRRHFSDAGGNLYDGGLLQDIDAELKRDGDSGPSDRSDLVAMVRARNDEDFGQGMTSLESLLDMDSFLSLMAVERLICHWDGYTDNANNYRIYFDPTRGKAVFLPHGMDQILGDSGAQLYADATPMLSSAVLRSDVWFPRYRDRVRQFAPLVTDVAKLEAFVDRVAGRLQAPLAELGPEASASQTERVADLKRRIRQRAAFLLAHIDEERGVPLRFDGEAPQRILAWSAFRETDDMRLDAIERPGEHTEYRITCQGAEPVESSWRSSVPLARGRYRLSVAMRTDEVLPPPDEPTLGATLFTSAAEPRFERQGTTEWSDAETEIEVREDWRSIDCVVRLRAVRGSVTFRDARIVRLP